MHHKSLCRYHIKSILSWRFPNT